jgi:hypothetical protein
MQVCAIGVVLGIAFSLSVAAASAGEGSAGSAGGMYAAGASGGGAEGTYAAWENGPPSEAGYFPIGVWLQDPANAAAYRELGINMYIGLWRGPTEAQLAALKEAGMRVICGQNEVGLAHRSDATIIGWLYDDEPDNAQPLPEGGYGPATPTQEVMEDYQRMRANDPTRPVLLNLGQGVANDEWVGIGCDRSEYPAYVAACDIVSFDVYPVVGIRKADGENYLWYVAKGVDRLREWSGGRKIVWNVVECTHISEPEKKATPHQVRAEVWMSLIHGTQGLVYFVHQFEPRLVEAALLEDEEMRSAVREINGQIRELAPVLNGPTVEGAVEVVSTDPNVPVDVMVKRRGEDLYVFAVGMRNAPTRGEFSLVGLGEVERVEVLWEGREVRVEGGRFEDAFEPYDVHAYRMKVGR